MSGVSSSRSSKTFKPKKNIPEGSHQYELLKHAEATLGSGNLRQAVMLPEGEDLNEWIAVNTVDFFNQINMLYGTITEFCTEASCPVMSAGPRYEYHWADGTNIKKPIKCSAPKYIDYLMTWVQDQLDDETLFPSKIGVPFPKNFMSVAKTILKRLFRVYAHIYHQHFDSVMQLQEEAHLNTSFKHFIFFVQLPLLHCAKRMFASQTEGELKVTQILKEKFPRATAIKVTDISEVQADSELGVGWEVSFCTHRMRRTPVPWPSQPFVVWFLVGSVCGVLMESGLQLDMGTYGPEACWWSDWAIWGGTAATAGPQKHF
ncbi:Mob4B protein-like protein [Camelus ferus]|nr:Mob4B protein-like protein [Camelus ferus]